MPRSLTARSSRNCGGGSVTCSQPPPPKIRGVTPAHGPEFSAAPLRCGRCLQRGATEGEKKTTRQIPTSTPLTSFAPTPQKTDRFQLHVLNTNKITQSIHRNLPLTDLDISSRIRIAPPKTLKSSYLNRHIHYFRSGTLLLLLLRLLHLYSIGGTPLVSIGLPPPSSSPCTRL